MATWVSAAVSLFVGLAGLFALFYFKWVPNVDDQKRHIKRAASWALDILSVASQGAAIYYFVAQVKGPVTPRIVVMVAVFVSAVTFTVISIVIRRWVIALLFQKHLNLTSRIMDQTGRHIEIAGRHLAVTEKHREALRIIAGDPKLSVETARALRTLLGGDEQPDDAPPRLTAAGGNKPRKTSRSLPPPK